jgi:hypothetical protein
LAYLFLDYSLLTVNGNAGLVNTPRVHRFKASCERSLVGAMKPKSLDGQIFTEVLSARPMPTTRRKI